MPALRHYPNDDGDCEGCPRDNNGDLPEWPCKYAKAEIQRDYPDPQAALWFLMGMVAVMVRTCPNEDPRVIRERVAGWLRKELWPEPKPAQRITHAPNQRAGVYLR